jgi:hypothetical protein
MSQKNYLVQPSMPHAHKEEPTCACGMNRICFVCGMGAGAIPCRCSVEPPQAINAVVPAGGSMTDGPRAQKNLFSVEVADV